MVNRDQVQGQDRDQDHKEGVGEEVAAVAA